MQLYLLDIVHSPDGVVLTGVESGGAFAQAIDRTYLPKVLVEPTHAEKLKELGLHGEPVTRTFEGKKLSLLSVPIADMDTVRALKGGVYESQLSPTRRYLIDRGIRPFTWIDTDTFQEEERAAPALRTMAFDIETVEGKVVMISLADTLGMKKVLTYGTKVAGAETLADEGGMIARFCQIVQEQDPSIMVGYNSDSFDVSVLAERAAACKVPFAIGRNNQTVAFSRRRFTSAAGIPGRVHIDLFRFVGNILASSLETDTLSLDMVAKELLGKGKLPLDWKDIEHAWKKKQLKRVVEYSLHDSVLTLDLATYLLPQLQALCLVVGQTPFDVARMSYSQLVEWLYMRRARESGELIPNPPYYQEIQRRRKNTYLGGYVHTPVRGIHESIGLFDFASLYPSIVITHNISPDTLDCTCCTGNAIGDHHFCTKRKGFIPQIIEQLFEERRDLKQQLKKLPKEKSRALQNRQYALKILANASYGYYGYAGSRWYSRACAESITAWGRSYIKDMIALAEKQYRVLYGDTDSLFVQMPEDAIPQFLRKVNDVLPGVMELEFKGFYPRGLFVATKEGRAAKKRYALLDTKGNLVIRGFEFVRRDWSPIARHTQEQVLLAVLKEQKPAKAVTLTRAVIAQLQDGTVPLEKLAITSELTKPIEEYKQIGPHVAVAKKMRERGMSPPLGLITYIITPGKGSISERAEPLEHATSYDPEYYIQNQLLPVVLRVLGELGYTEDDFLNKGLEKFLKKR